MGQSAWRSAWADIIRLPLAARSQKPRTEGLTMIMDKGLGLKDTAELLSVAGNYLDYVKLAFGTPALYHGDLLREKISLVRAQQVQIYPGGTFFEIAIWQDKMEGFLARARELGFSAIEVSDGTISLPPETRRRAIKTAAAMGFTVLSEVGKKDPSQNLPAAALVNQIEFDLAAGAGKVILEARESGTGIGIFNHLGGIKQDFLAELMVKIRDPKLVIWEAPLKNQQQELILTFGSNVNLGNIPPAEVLALESLRVGLRADTLKTVISQSQPGC